MSGATGFDALPAPQQAGILCNDPEFRRFVGVRTGIAPPVSPGEAAKYLRGICRIASRAALVPGNPGALDRFARLRTEFDAWRGRIARQRRA